MDAMFYTLAEATGDWAQRMNEGFGIFVLGIATVFANLVILMIIISVVGAITGKKSKNSVPKKRSKA